jgi:hypothetical protein
VIFIRKTFFLESGTSYNVTILLLNTFQNKTRSNEYSYLYKTQGEQRISSEQESNLLGLLALLLIIPIAAIIYMKRDELLSFKKEVFKRSNTCKYASHFSETLKSAKLFQQPKYSISKKTKSLYPTWHKIMSSFQSRKK